MLGWTMRTAPVLTAECGPSGAGGGGLKNGAGGGAGWTKEEGALGGVGCGSPILGAGGGVTDSSWFWNNYSIIDSLFENGYACFDVNGGSMGGLSSTNFVYKHSNIVLAHAMYSPVLDLYGQA